MQTSARSAVLMDVVVPRSAGQSAAMRVALDVALIVGFAGFVALCAQIAIRIPWTTVPITGQTFAVLVTGGALGAKRGAGALLVYMLMGMASIPVFAPGGSALPQGTWGVHFILPWSGTGTLPWDIASGGYIVGFIPAAYVAGHFAQRAWDRKPWGILAMLGGNAVLYVPGLLWLYYLYATDFVSLGASNPLGEMFRVGSGSWGKTLSGGLYPFIVGDLMKLYLATLALPSAWALVNRLKGGGSRPPGA